MGPNPEREVSLGELLQKGEGLGVRTSTESRQFHAGDHIMIAPNEFSGICLTTYLAGDTIREALENAWIKL